MIFLKAAVATLVKLFWFLLHVAGLLLVSLHLVVAMPIMKNEDLHDELWKEILIVAVQHVFLAVMFWISDFRDQGPPPESALLAEVPKVASVLAVITGVIRALIYWLDMGHPFSTKRSLASDLDMIVTILESIIVLFGDELV